ncbi:hypothetical protein ACFE04_010964 [Oxalis oulophora]
MELITILLLSILFIASLTNIYLNLHYYQFKPLTTLKSFLRIKPLPSSSTSTNEEGESPNPKTILPEKPEMKKVFATFDKNGDGFITKQELKDSLKNIRIIVNDDEVDEMVARVDENGDGLIDFEEFVTLCETLFEKGTTTHREQEHEHEHDQEEGDLKEAFDVFDKDKDGLISVEELGLVLCCLGLNEGKKIDDCKEMIRKVDVDGDGMVNFDEFKLMMRSNVFVSS